MTITFPEWKTSAATALLALGVALSTGTALAEPTSADRAAAQSLFDSGIALMQERRFADACPKLQESQRLDPSVGTLFNLSDCYERVGRLASAWAGFREVADLARLQKQTKREEAAAARAAALQPRIATLTVEVQGEVPEGLEVRRDGVLVGAGQWGTPVPVDPGEHEIVATAPGKQKTERKVVIAREAQAEVVRVPPLADAETATASPLATPEPPAMTPPPASPPSAPAQDSGVSATVDSSSPQRTWAYVVGGVGLVGLGASGVLAWQAKSKYNDSLSSCGTADKNRCDATGVGLRDDARRAGTYATIAFGVGAAALAGGVALWVTAPAEKSSGSARALQAAPLVGRDGAGMLVGGTF